LSAPAGGSAGYRRRPDTSPDGEGEEELVRCPGDHVEDRPAVLDRRGDVQEDDLVGSLLVVPLGELDRVPGIAEPGEVRSLDDPPVFEVKTGDDAAGESHKKSVRMEGLSCLCTQSRRF